MSTLLMAEQNQTFSAGPNLARPFPTHLKSGLTLPVHFWLAALKWAVILVGATGIIYVLEKYFFMLKGTDYRMVHNPAEFAVRFFGLAHYTVATYLLFTSKGLRTVRGVLMMLLFSTMAFAACTAFYYFGGYKNVLAVVAVFFFFLMHAIRDEVFFYRLRSGKAITDEEYPHVYRMLIWLQFAGLCLLAGLLYPSFIYKFSGDPHQAEFNAWINLIFPTGWSIGAKMAASLIPFLVISSLILLRIQLKHQGGVWALLKSHAPLTVILSATVTMALSSIVIGSWILDVIILIHFTGWFLFATDGISKQPPKVRKSITWRNPNQWIRKNMVGFWVFHGGLAVMFFGLMACNSWVLAGTQMTVAGQLYDNPLTILFSEGSLFYWTITHCTLGFLPKPKPKAAKSAAREPVPSGCEAAITLKLPTATEQTRRMAA